MSTIMKFNFQLLTIIAFGLILSPLNARFILIQLKENTDCIDNEVLCQYIDTKKHCADGTVREKCAGTCKVCQVSRLDDVPPLHSGWKEMTTDEGKSFYVDLANMKVQWERPIHGTQNRNATSVQARSDFPEGCCICIQPGPPLCKVSCCPEVIPTPGEEGSDGTFHALPVEQLGCWSDAGYTPKALQDVEHILKQLWPEDVSIQFREKPIVLCFGTAKYMGRKIFAVQDGGKCFAEGPAVPLHWRGDHKFYGPSEECKNDGKGGAYANEVYGWMKLGDDGWEDYCPQHCKTCKSGHWDYRNGGLPVNINGFCQHFCTFENGSVTAPGYCGKGVKYYYGVDCTECKTETKYDCKAGQGEYEKELPKYLYICDMKECEKACTNNGNCKGFDFTSKKCLHNSCRLYPKNNPRTDAGFHERKYCEKLKECDSPSDCIQKFGETKPKCNDGVCFACADDIDCPELLPFCYENKCYEIKPASSDNTPKIQSYGSFKWIILDQSDVHRLLGKDAYYCPSHGSDATGVRHADSVLFCKSPTTRLLDVAKLDISAIHASDEVDPTRLSVIPQWRESLRSCLTDAFEPCDRFLITCEYYWWRIIDWTSIYYHQKTGNHAKNPNDPATCPVAWRDNWG